MADTLSLGEIVSATERVELGEVAGDTVYMDRSFGDSLSMARPTSLLIVGDRLLITDLWYSPHVSIFDRSTGEHLHRFGIQGKGPREFINPFSSILISVEPSRAWIWDFKNRRFSKVAVDASEPPFVVEEFPFNIAESLLTPTIVQGKIVSTGLFADYTLLFVDNEGGPAVRVAGHPPFDEQVLPHFIGRRLANVNRVVAHPDGDRLAVFYQFKNQIDFFTSDGAWIGSTRGPRESSAKFHISEDRFFWDDGNEMAYTEVRATRRFIYAMFCGLCSEENRFPNLLHLFRWNGEFVAEYLMEPGIAVFDITPDDRQLYGAFESEESHPLIGQWWLPEGLGDHRLRTHDR